MLNNKKESPMNKRIILALTLALFPILTFAQSDVNTILKNITGNVDEIVIKSDGKEYKFSGDEAQKLFSSMKNKKEVKSFSFTTKDVKVFEGDSLNKKIIIKELGDESNGDSNVVIVLIDEDDFDTEDSDIKTIEKKVLVSEENGKKVVKVTTKEDGKENTEIYEGKAADDYLEKMKSENEIEVNVNVQEEEGKKIKKIIIEKEVEKEE